MNRITLKTSDWPIVLTTVEGDIDESNLVPYFAEFQSRVLARAQLFSSIVDATRITSAPSARVRRLIADWEVEHGAVGERYNVGVAIVTTSALVRGAMTAIQWISPPRVPTTYEATMPAAIAWAHGHLRQRGVVVGAEARVG